MSFHLNADVRPGGTSLTEYFVSSKVKGIPLDPGEIIKDLRAHPNLKSLNFRHGALGDEGSKFFFQWLVYGENDGIYEENNEKGKRLSPPLPQLTEISLIGDCLSDIGFGALVGWLERLKKQQMNKSISLPKTPAGIRLLSLQNNHIEGTSELALAFVSALTFRKIEPPYISPSLSYLNLSSNPLSSGFKQALFSSLASLPSLRKLVLAMTGLNRGDAGALAAYIGQCRLTYFNASGNDMGYSGLKTILKAMKRCWTLEGVEMYANDTEDRADHEYGSSDEYEEESLGNPDLTILGTRQTSGYRWRLLERKIQRIISRNVYLKGIVGSQAFELLSHSRLLLLNRQQDHGRSSPDLLEELVGQEAPHHSRCIHDCECLPTFYNAHSRTPSPFSNDPHVSSNSHFPFTRLPMEIQLIVLSQLAPILSSSQQIGIFEYAIDKTTLPDLSLRFPSSTGGGELLRTTYLSTSTPPTSAYGRSGSRPGSSKTVSAGSKSVAHGDGPFVIVPKVATEKQKLLELVGCDAYDPNE